MFFGKVPKTINKAPVAQLYERAWWATYIPQRLTFCPYEKAVTPEHEHFYVTAQLGRGGRKVLEKAIVNKLRELNVVLADTQSGQVAQMSRIAQGAPVPTVVVEGAIENADAQEALAAYRWAKSFVEKAPDEAALKYFPPAQTRPLKPLKPASY